MLETLQRHPEMAESVHVKVAECDQMKCTLCGECVTQCPVYACDLTDAGRLAIEPTYCIGCGLCAEVCEDHAITIVEHDGKDLVVVDPEAERKKELAAQAKQEAAEAKKEVKKTLNKVLDGVEKLAD